MLNRNELPEDYFESCHICLVKQDQDLPEYYLSFYDIDIAYSYTLVKLGEYKPTFRKFKLPGTLYEYVPDQRPITIRQIGKPSSGPSPPRIISFQRIC